MKYVSVICSTSREAMDAGNLSTVVGPIFGPYDSEQKAQTAAKQWMANKPVIPDVSVVVRTVGETPQIRMVCERCGGDNVLLDAWAQWNVETQEWELADTLEQEYCGECEDETHIAEVIETSQGLVLPKTATVCPRGRDG